MPTVTVSQIGAGQTFTTVADWFAARCFGRSFSGEDIQEIGEINGTVSGILDANTVFGLTATQNWILRAASGQKYDPVADTGAKMVDSSSSSTITMNNMNYAVIEDIAVVPEGTSNKIGWLFNNTHTGTIVRNVFLNHNSSGGGRVMQLINTTAAGNTLRFENFIARQGPLYTGTADVIRGDNALSSDMEWLNCTFHATTGANAVNRPGAARWRNCACIGGWGGLLSSGMNVDYCASDDGSAAGTGTGPNNVPNVPLTDWVDPSGSNYRAASGTSLLVDAGEDQSGIFTLDFIGNTHGSSGAWEICSYDFSAGPPPGRTRRAWAG